MNKDSFDGPNAAMKQLKGSLTGSGTDHHRPKGAPAGRAPKLLALGFGSSLPTPLRPIPDPATTGSARCRVVAGSWPPAGAAQRLYRRFQLQEVLIRGRLALKGIDQLSIMRSTAR